MRFDVESAVGSVMAGRVLEDSEYYRFGYRMFGPFLLGYTGWLARRLREERVDSALFLARDGYMMRAAFRLCEERFPSGLKGFYFYCSRKSLRQALLWRCKGFADSLKYVNESKRVSLGYMLEYYGFSEAESAEIAATNGIDLDRAVSYAELAAWADLERLYDGLADTIRERSRRQDELLLRYLGQFELGARCAVVDIGWHGSMQYYLELFCQGHGIAVEFVGLYVGVYPFHPLRGRAAGYLFSTGEDPARRKTLCFFGVLEKLFQSAEGSTVGYSDAGGAIVPVNMEYEYAGQTEILDSIDAWQRAALDFISDAQRSGVFPSGEREWADGLMRFGRRPTLEETRLFAFFYNYDGRRYGFLPQKPLLRYRPSAFIRALNDSPWKTGFLKAAFKLPLPYYWIYRALS